MNASDMIWPNFFVVGAPKAGTTSLYEYLKPHPQVFLSEVKEPKYFSPQLLGSVSLERYRRLYEKAGGISAIGDLSPFYLWDSAAPQRIHDVSPDAKIIVMLRDPVARAYSHYLMAVALGHEKASFSQGLSRYSDREARDWYLSSHYIEHGMYGEQVERYLNVFPADRIAIFLFDELVGNPRHVLTRIAGHLGIDPEPFAAVTCSEAHNIYRMPRFPKAIQLVWKFGLNRVVPPALRKKLKHNSLLFNVKKPSMDEPSRRYLQELYEPDVARLEKLLGRKFPELRKSWI
jgi:hypothetical protein